MLEAESHRPWAFQPVVIQGFGVVYGLAMGLFAMAAFGSVDLVPIALSLAFPLGVLGPVGCLFGTPVYYAWICTGLSSGRATVRVPVLLCLSYAFAAFVCVGPDWSDTAHRLFSQDTVSIWVGLVLYAFGQVWLWSCWVYIRRTRASAPPAVDTDVDTE